MPPASRQGLAQPTLHTRAIQPARSTVIQRSNSEKVDFEIEVVKGDDFVEPSGTKVEMANNGTWTYAPCGLYTQEVRNCIVLCMFSSLAYKDPLPRIYMHHSSWYDLMPEEAWKVVKDWGTGFKGYIIGGNNTGSFAKEDLVKKGWSDLNIAGVMSPLTELGHFANVQIKDQKITYWIHDDKKSTNVNLLNKI